LTELETTKLLTQLATGGLAMVVVSWLLEQSARFHALEAQAKAWIVLGLTLVVALLSQAVLTFVPAAWLVAAEPFVKVALIAIAGWLTSQAYHAMQKRVGADAVGADGVNDDGAQG
jgi:hypothetical protein